MPDGGWPQDNPTDGADLLRVGELREKSWIPAFAGMTKQPKPLL